MTTELSAHRKAELELDYQIRSSRPLIYICTHEENRVMNALKALAERDKQWTILSWDVADGLHAETEYANMPPSDTYLDAGAALDWFEQTEGINGAYIVLVLKDFQKILGSDGHRSLYENQITRKIRNLCELFMRQKKALIIVGSSLYLPEEIEKMAAIIDWPLPEPVDIEERVTALLESAKKTKKLKFKLDYDAQELDDIVQAFRGLTINEIEMIVTYMMTAYNHLDSVIIASKKRDIIRKSGAMDWIEPKWDITNVGGVQALKKWLKSRNKAFSKEAQEYGLPAPKGVVLVGVQGCGKSLLAYAIASYYGIPLLRLDMGKIFSSLVGSSEENIRAAIKIAESVSPCILWIDELEKGFSGVSSSDQSDGGTTARVFATFLTWTQEKVAPVFIVATANDISKLPPEILRKGRFDEIFFVDLPSLDDRKDIFDISFKKYNRDPSDFNVIKLANLTKAFTGAEIEASIVSAMHEAFSEGREVSTDDVISSIDEIVPLSVTMEERISALREWAKIRARNASFAHDNNNKKNTKEIKDQTSSLMASIDLEDDEEL